MKFMKMREYKILRYIAILFLLVLISCNNTQIFTRDVQLLQSKAINLLNEDELIISNKILRGFAFLPSEVKLVVYNDSTECSPCFIRKMHLWNSLLKYAESYAGRLRYYFIFAPAKKDVISVQVALANHFFDYPVLIDTLGNFEKLNPHLPKNKAMHTFLLDENNKVILVGNPLYNKEIEKLFYKITQEKLSK